MGRLLYLLAHDDLGRVMRKSDICLCENKHANQLHSNCEADQRLCFRYMDRTIPLLEFKISRFLPSSSGAQTNQFVSELVRNP